MKKKEIEINGKKYPVNCGFGTIEKLQDVTGTIVGIDEFTTTDKGEVSLRNTTTCLVICINAGYEEAEKDITVTHEEILKQIIKDKDWSRIQSDLINVIQEAVISGDEDEEDNETSEDVESEGN